MKQYKIFETPAIDEYHRLRRLTAEECRSSKGVSSLSSLLAEVRTVSSRGIISLVVDLGRKSTRPTISPSKTLAKSSILYIIVTIITIYPNH
jgi:hypothetical protein